MPRWRMVIGRFGKIKLLAGLAMVYKNPSLGDYFIVRRVAPWMRLNSWLRLSLGDVMDRVLFGCLLLTLDFCVYEAFYACWFPQLMCCELNCRADLCFEMKEG